MDRTLRRAGERFHAKGYYRYLKVDGDNHFVIDEKQIKAEARYDGCGAGNTLCNARDGRAIYRLRAA